MKKLLLALLLSSLGLNASASAVYTTSASWTAAVSDSDSVGFEGISAANGFVTQGSVADIGGLHFSSPNNNMHVIGANYAESGGTFGSGTGASLFGYSPGITISQTDGGLFNAFSVNLRGYLEGSTAFTLTFSDGETFNVSASNPAGVFFGVTLNQAVSSVLVGTNSLYLDLDNVATAAAAVPEPASIALMGLGIAGLIGTRRRKAAKQ